MDGSPEELITAHIGRHVIELEGPDQALRDYVKDNRVEHDDLGRRLILYVKEGEELSDIIRERFCTDTCIFRNSSLEDVFLRLTGRELRE